MNYAVLLCLYFIKRYILLFLIIFFSSLWSFLINPIYFILPCFAPLIFLYFYSIYKKNYKALFIVFFANFPFALIYSMIALGTARLNITENLLPQDRWYNFEIYHSPIFLIISIFAFFLTIQNFLKNKYLGFIKLLFLISFFLTIFFGLIWKYNLVNWQLPQPAYFDYTAQYIYISVIIILFIDNYSQKINYLIFLFLIVIFSYKTFKIIKIYDNSNKILNSEKKIFYDKKKYLKKKWFWEKDNTLFC